MKDVFTKVGNATAGVRARMTLTDNLGLSFLFIWLALSSLLIGNEIFNNIYYRNMPFNPEVNEQLVVYKSKSGNWVVKDNDIIDAEIFNFILEKNYAYSSAITFEGSVRSYTYYWRGPGNDPAPESVDIAYIPDDNQFVLYLVGVKDALNSGVVDNRIYVEEPEQSGLLTKLNIPSLTLWTVFYTFIIGYFITCAVRTILHFISETLIQHQMRKLNSVSKDTASIG